MIRLFAALTAATLLSCVSLAQPITWTGLGDGVSWKNPNNWNPVGVPGNTSDVSIPAVAGNAPVVIESAGLAAVARSIATARPIDVLGTLTVRGGGIALAAGSGGATTFLLVRNFIDFIGPQAVTGSGEIRFRNGSLYSTGTMPGNGSVTIDPGVTLRTDGGTGSLWWNSNPPVTFIVNGPITLNNGFALNVNSRTTLDARAPVSISQSGSALRATNSDGPIINRSTITVADRGTFEAFNLTNLGTLTVQEAQSNATLENWNNAGGQINALLNSTIRLRGTYSPASLVNLTRATGGRILLGGTINTGTLSLPDGLPIELDSNARLNAITLGADASLNSGSIAVAGGLNLNGRTFSVGNAIIDFLGTQSIAGPGLIRTVSGTASFYASNQASVTINSNVELRTAGGSLNLWYNSGPPARFINRGLIAASAGQSLTVNTLTTLENRGVVQLGVGGSHSFSNLENFGEFLATGQNTRVTLNAWSNPSGSIRAETNAQILLLGEYPVANLQGFSISNGGRIRLGGTVRNGSLPAGSLPADFDSSVTLDAITFAANTTLTSTIATVSNNLALANNAQLSLSSSTLNFPGNQSITGQGVIRAVGSGNIYVSNQGTLTIDPGITCEALTGPLNFWWNSGPPVSFINRGVIRALGSNAVTFFSQTSLDNRGLIEAAASSRVDLIASNVTNVTPVSGTISRGAWAVRGTGTLQFTPSLTAVRALADGASLLLDGPTATIQPNINQLATIGANSGLILAGGRSQSISPVGGVLANAGSISLRRGTLLNVAGNFAQSAQATLTHELEGPATAERGRLAVSGSLSLGGTLIANLIPPYAPACGTRISLATASSLSSARPEQIVGTPANLPAGFEFAAPAVDLVVGVPFAIFAQPQGQILTPCSTSATISVGLAPTGVTGVWRRDDVPLADGPTGTGSTISGSATTRLTITNPGPSDLASYTFAFSSSCGPAVSEPARFLACPGDWDCDGTVDFNDLLAFLNDFNAQDPRADLDGDGVIDFNDFLAFLNLFNTPC